MKDLVSCTAKFCSPKAKRDGLVEFGFVFKATNMIYTNADLLLYYNCSSFTTRVILYVTYLDMQVACVAGCIMQ
jgi:hypothetical protein